MKGTIICIGNRFLTDDVAGMEVYDLLQQMSSLPEEVELVEGGIAGLNLLPLMERGGRLVFVDAVTGFTEPGQCVILTGADIQKIGRPVSFGHEAGLAYLLSIFPKVSEGDPPKEIFIVGLEGACSSLVIKQAAGLSLQIAVNGNRGAN